MKVNVGLLLIIACGQWTKLSGYPLIYLAGISSSFVILDTPCFASHIFFYFMDWNSGTWISEKSVLHFLLYMAALHDTLTAEVQRLKLANTELMDEGRASSCTSQQGQMKHHIFQMQRQQPNQIQ